MRRWDNKYHENVLRQKRLKLAEANKKPTPDYDTSTNNNRSAEPSTMVIHGNN